MSETGGQTCSIATPHTKNLTWIELKMNFLISLQMHCLKMFRELQVGINAIFSSLANCIQYPVLG